MGGRSMTYAETADASARFAAMLMEIGTERNERVAFYAEKRFEAVTTMFGTSRAGAVFVPINPMLKAEQVRHILGDCDVRVLVTSGERLEALRAELEHCPDLAAIFLIGDCREYPARIGTARVERLEARTAGCGQKPERTVIDADMAAILYTSGSTGKPKGVILSHRNIVAGAISVAEYLEITAQDRLLCVLPLSFDYGLNQLTSAFLKGGTAILINHLFPRDIVKAVVKHHVTGLAAVPPLWIQLANLDWPAAAQEHLRYITNSGGVMPGETLARLQALLPRTKPYLMYGLTEAFRSTWLPPSEIARRPDSIGKAIPHAEIMVVRPDGTPCEPGEAGELVHRGVHVAMGYWNDAERTAARFKPAPGLPEGIPVTELAVWSGDIVRADDEGYLYFVGRRDEMIKTSGFRVSPSEIEEVLHSSPLVAEAAALGLPHRELGQAIAVVVTAAEGSKVTVELLLEECSRRLPVYMVPRHVEILDQPLPRNPNGKIDRQRLAAERKELFST